MEDLRRAAFKRGLAQLDVEGLLRLRNAPREKICLDTCNYDEQNDTY